MPKRRGVAIGAVVLSTVGLVLAGTAVSSSAAVPRVSPLTEDVPSATPPNVGTFYQLSPARILDTRTGNGSPAGTLGQDSTMSLQVTGRGGVPSTGVSAVVLNVTTTGATGDSYLTVWPSGVDKPNASSLNFVHGWEGANSVTVALGADGKVNIYNHLGSTQVIADVVGFYAANDSMVGQYGTGGNYQVVTPERLFDSRAAWGAKLHAGNYVRVPVSYGPENDAHIRALVVNVTSVDAEGPGYLTTWDGLGALPDTSTLNYVPGQVVPNLAIAPVSRCSDCGGDPSVGGYISIGVYTHQESNVIVDIMGVIDDGTLPDGLRFTPRTPQRIADTRINQGSSGPIGQFGTATITAPGDVAGDDTWALAMNVTAVTPTMLTYLTVWPAGDEHIPMPNSSNLNPAAGQTVPNAVYGLVGPTNAINVYNNHGSVHLVVDVVGTFELAPVDTPPAASAARTNARSLAPATGTLSLTGDQGTPVQH